jgi:ferritin-like metal-binding protein YciE
VRLADAFDRAGHALVRGSESLRRSSGERLPPPPGPPVPPARPAPPAVRDARDLYLAGLAEALWAERQIAQALLPTLAEAVVDPELSGLLDGHVEVARAHPERIEQAFRAAGAEPRAERCPALAGLAERHSELSGSTRPPAVADLGHAVFALEAQLHSIAVHRVLELQARGLGLAEAAELLAANRREEEQALDALDPAISRLAEEAAAPPASTAERPA